MYLFFHFSFFVFLPFPLPLVFLLFSSFVFSSATFLPILSIGSSSLVLSPLVQLSALLNPPLLPNSLRILVSLHCPNNTSKLGMPKTYKRTA